MSENIINDNIEENVIGNEKIDKSSYEEITPKPRKFDICKRDIVFSFIFLFCSAVFSFMGLWGGFRMGFTVSSVITTIAITVYVINKTTKINFFCLLCGIFSLLLSFSFAITSNSSVRVWSFCVLIVLSLIWFCSLAKPCEKSDYGILTMIFKPVFYGACSNLAKSMMSLFSGKNKNRKALGSAVLGAVLAFPVLLVVVPLLISSDAAFSGLAMNLIENVAGSVLKLIVALIIAPFIISYCFSLKKDEQKPCENVEIKSVDTPIIISFLSVMSVCYLTYLFSQLAYFFSAFSGFLPDDYSFTVSEYARRGFFEMCIIAAINFIIILVCLLLSRKNEGKISVATKILCTFVGFFTLVIIATALSKMFLYIKSFGMTELRITTTAFMIFLSVTFISLMIKVFISKIRVLRVALISAAAVLTLLGIFNINNIIAGYNYNAYINGKLDKIDVYAIYELGEEGIPYLAKLTESDDYTVASKAEQWLKEVVYKSGKYYENFYDEEGYYSIGKKLYTDLGQFSFSRNKAYKVLDEYLSENPEVLYFEPLNEYGY